MKPHTTRLLIEVANFNKTNIRETSRKLGLRSEASSRYEKGVDPNLAALASDRVCQLIEALGAGTVVGGIIDHYPVVAEPLKIAVRTQRVNQMLGTAFSTREIEALLARLSLEMEVEGETLLVTAPTYRPDLTREIDFVEEVARLYGYDRIPTTLPRGNGWGAKTNGQHREDVSKELLLGCGLSEITTYSFVSPRSLDLIRIPDYSYLRSTVNLMNPLGEEYSIMRTTLLPNMMEVLARNAKRNVPQAAFFEIGNLFFPKQVPVTELPLEKKALSIGLYGGGSDFFTLKGIVCKYLERMGIRGYRFVTEANNDTFHPGRCAAVIMGNHVIGTLGRFTPRFWRTTSCGSGPIWLTWTSTSWCRPPAWTTCTGPCPSFRPSPGTWRSWWPMRSPPASWWRSSRWRVAPCWWRPPSSTSTRANRFLTA